MTPRSYSDAGVDVSGGDRFATFISRLPSKSISPTIGAFAGGIPLPTERYRNPVLLGATDGVGTKLLVARRLGDYSTIGIDLVAMCVNDLAVCGADPLFFLDYIACGKLDQPKLEQIIGGVVRGCELADCTLAGGETAEMPDMYGADDIDLAGFATGVAEADHQLPQSDSIKAGDVILGLSSTGVHSNGFSLARKALFEADDAVWRELLTPTRIYVRELAKVRCCIKAAAHVTGGGLEGNLTRVVPENLQARLTWDWPIPEIFAVIERSGSIPQQEMRAVFNMGIGIAVVVAEETAGKIPDLIGEPVIHLGEVVDG
ncbi:MAG: phosphoribosylformylglycinamidine cyclo-ligase [Spirochaetales bacterium]|nr:phosphoribosylformylglycinamidine cyclo-ligase [Spirochaetales bacterium]